MWLRKMVSTMVLMWSWNQGSLVVMLFSRHCLSMTSPKMILRFRNIFLLKMLHFLLNILLLKYRCLNCIHWKRWNYNLLMTLLNDPGCRLQMMLLVLNILLLNDPCFNWFHWQLIVIALLKNNIIFLLLMLKLLLGQHILLLNNLCLSRICCVLAALALRPAIGTNIFISYGLEKKMR